ncbi:hypothetical protein HDV00_001484 [Rhizophlyctis rosea]|nr:hypothetical protein HDV00_001484 [Rhizophlyctis rosea]
MSHHFTNPLSTNFPTVIVTTDCDRAMTVQIARQALRISARPQLMSKRTFLPPNHAWKWPVKPPLPTAPELWTLNQTGGQKIAKKQPQIEPNDIGDLPWDTPQEDIKNNPDALFAHPYYNQIQPVNVGVGPLLPPLKWPEYDQARLSYEDSGLPGGWRKVEWDNYDEAPIGNYPRLPMQWAELKDPYRYWDPQGRRNYGDLEHVDAQYLDEWGPGPQERWEPVLSNALKQLAMVAVMALCVWYYNPADRRYFAEKTLPFDGLRLELGGDPDDPNDRSTAARVYVKP